MPELSQAEFTRAVRGARIVPGADPRIEPVLMGITSVAHAAVRKVHRDSPAVALAYFNSRVAKYAGGPAWSAARAFGAALGRYVAWEATVGAPVRVDGSGDGIDVKLVVPFGPGDAVRAISHVVVDDGAGGSEARIVLWDELRLDQRSAEMIALPILEAADARYGGGTTSVVKVWHVALNHAVSVAPTAARARQTQIQALIAGL
jgi:hypothetical protein